MQHPLMQPLLEAKVERVVKVAQHHRIINLRVAKVVPRVELNKEETQPLLVRLSPSSVITCGLVANSHLRMTMKSSSPWAQHQTLRRTPRLTPGTRLSADSPRRYAAAGLQQHPLNPQEERREARAVPKPSQLEARKVERRPLLRPPLLKTNLIHLLKIPKLTPLPLNP